MIIHQKLNRSGTNVVACFCNHHSRIANLFSQFRRYDGRWCFFHHFLVTALNAALSFKTMNYVAEFICQHLHFYMAWRAYIFFQEHSAIAKCRLCFADGPVHLFLKVGFFFYYPHTLTTTAGRGFYQNRIADFCCHFFGVGYIFNGFVYTGHHRDVEFFYTFLCCQFRSHYPHGFRSGTNKSNACIFYLLRKICILT